MRKSKERIHVYFKNGENLIKMPSDKVGFTVPIFNYYPNIGDTVELYHHGRKNKNLKDEDCYGSVIHQSPETHSIVLSEKSIRDTEVVSLLRNRPSMSKMNSLFSYNHAYQIIVVDSNYQILDSKLVKAVENSKLRDPYHLRENFERGKAPLILPAKYKGKGLLVDEVLYPYFWVPIVALKKS